MKRRQKTIKMVTLAILIAIVAVLQALGLGIKIGPYSISLVGVPIVLGAILLGPRAGMILGFTFALVVMFSPDVTAFMGINPFYTILIVFGKAMLGGFVSGIVYKALKKANNTLACIVASITFPIVNTGVFVIGVSLLFNGWLNETAAATGASAFYFLFVVLVGINFLIEFGINAVLSPVIARLSVIGFDRLMLEEKRGK